MKQINLMFRGIPLSFGSWFVLFSAILSIGATNLSAQNKSSKITVSGIVTDATTKQPIVGASVWIKDGTSGIVTNNEGRYVLTFEASKNSVLAASFLGYTTL